MITRRPFQSDDDPFLLADDFDDQITHQF